MPTNNKQKNSPRQIGIVKNILSTALKLWLKSQVSNVSQLEVNINAKDRQIISGCVPWVSVRAKDAVYKGIHITQIDLVAENICINIGSVLKGKPLKLLETVPVNGELRMEEEDLNMSASSPLFSNALNDILVNVLPNHWSKSKSTSWQNISIQNNKLVILATLDDRSEPQSVEITLGLNLFGNHELKISPIRVINNTELLLNDEYGRLIDLGTEVDIEQLTLRTGQLNCNGKVNVNP
ncbi:MAG: DUF2993 domain-containing protein [Cyanobacteria bacterium P01_A01_bin.84]